MPILSERFQVRARLGEGGMGVVYRAYDSVLHRDVALKLLHTVRGELNERFLREARAQARVDHPNVCKVYDAGFLGDRSFIAMQLIEGETLFDAAPFLPLEQRVLVVKLVAEGLHAAHRLGLIHRDVKPSNILVEVNEGDLRPYILDFGLARDTEGSSLTMTGFAAGTPNYMAPEQARGETARMDRRTDVYGLGATLYEVLAGRPVFRGESAIDTMMKVINEEPVPLASLDAQVPPDLSAVVMKCLEKDPAMRYDSAKALADDLQRYLDGEPVLAKPHGPAERFLRWARKNRAITAVSGFALIALLAVLGLFFWSQYKAVQRLELARRFASDVKDIEWFMQAVSMAPRHDVSLETAELTRRMRDMEVRMLALSPGERGTGYFALGRALLAMGDADQALARFRSAHREGLRTPELSYGIAVAASEVYGRKLDGLAGIRNDTARAARRTQLDRLYRAEILKRLRESRGAWLANLEYIEALIALHEKKYSGVRAKAEQITQRTPWDLNALRLRGNAFLAEAQEEAAAGQTAAARKLGQEGVRAFDAAIEVGRSDVRAYTGKARCLRFLAYVEGNAGGGEPFRKLAAEGIRAAGEALSVQPNHLPALTVFSSLHAQIAEDEFQRGLDPTGSLSVAKQAAEKVVTLDPSDAESYLVLAGLRWTEGRYLTQSRGDAREVFRRAAADARQAMAVNPAVADQAENIVGLVMLDQAGNEMNQDLDPLDSLEVARQCFENRLSRSPRPFVALINLSLVHMRRGEVLMSRNVDAHGDHERALELALKAWGLNTESYFPPLAALEAAAGMAMSMAASHTDPAPIVVCARDYYEEGRRRNSVAVRLPLAMGEALLAKALFEENRDPAAALRSISEGEQLAAEALRLFPGMYQAVWLQRELGDMKSRIGKRPGRPSKN